jgi:hypothetical protein
MSPQVIALLVLAAFFVVFGVAALALFATGHWILGIVAAWWALAPAGKAK